MQKLKKLTVPGIGRALAKAERYRLLGEPCEAESIYLDVLAADAGCQEARFGLLLALTDQFRTDLGRVAEARALAAELGDEYQRSYFTGVVAERAGKAHLSLGTPGSDDYANRALREAMSRYEKAAACRPPGDDDALLRWNACARILHRRHLEEPESMAVMGLFMTE